MTLNKKWVVVETMMVWFAVIAIQAGDLISHKVETSPASTIRGANEKRKDMAEKDGRRERYH